MRARLLIVEDDERLRLSLRRYFEDEGFDVSVAGDGAKALSILDEISPDLLILDVQLSPDVDGLDVCRAVRQRMGSSVGIIMISGIKKEEIDQVVGLEVGADVYLTKPCGPRKLLAQTKALLRRIKAQTASGWFVVDDYLRIHFERRQVWAGGREVTLSPLEFDVFAYLAQNSAKVCGKEDLKDAVYGPGALVSDATLGACVFKLRRKIEPDPVNPRYVRTAFGVGYRFGDF